MIAYPDRRKSKLQQETMKPGKMQTDSAAGKPGTDSPPAGNDVPVTRRKFLQAGAAAATTISIIPGRAWGAAASVAPSEKITVAYIGCGTQGIRELLRLLPMPEVQVVAVCDPVKDGDDYIDWSKDGLRASIARFLGQPDWRSGRPGIPGGREVAREIVETYYGRQRPSGNFRGC